MQSEVKAMKQDQQNFQCQVEERIKQFEDKQNEKMQDLEQKLENTAEKQERRGKGRAGDNEGEDAEEEAETMRRKKQVLVGGIHKEQDSEQTITMLNELMDKVCGGRHGIEVGTLNNRKGSLGMLEFPTVGSKISFYKKLQQQSDHGQLSFFDNLTFPERVREKRLGLIKHFMAASGDHADNDVKIVWPKKLVTLKGRKVAWYENEEIKMTQAARKHEQEVQQALKEWIGKRSGGDPETDSD